MKFIKSRFFFFLLGIIISGSIVFATTKIAADQIEYAPNVSVKDKIDDLYTKVKPAYTGTYFVTPSSTSQTLSTSSKYLSNDITVDAIPAQYKNISDTTITSASDILSGMIAYTADGTKLIGTRNECVSGSHTFTQNDTDNGVVLASFAPNYFNLYAINNYKEYIAYYNKNINSQQVYLVSLENSSVTNNMVNLGTSYIIDNNFKIKWGSSWIGVTIYYMACR